MFEGVDYFTLLYASVVDFMTTYASPFWTFGHRVFLAAVVIRLALMFYTILYRPMQDHEFFVGRTLVEIAIGYSLITFYATPDPIFGVALSRVIITLMTDMARVLDAAVMTTAVTTLDDIFTRFIPPGISEPLALLIYGLVFALLAVAKFLTLGIVALSLYAQAIFVLLGPIFVGFFLMPYFKRLFFRWLDSLLEYSFLQVTAFMYLLIGVHVLASFATAIPAELTTDLYPTWGGIVLVFVAIYAFGFTRIERINASLFSGHAAQMALTLRSFKW